MDNYLQEQQEKLLTAKKNFVRVTWSKLIHLFIIWLGIAIAVSLITGVIGSLFKTQDVDECTHTEIVFKGQLSLSGSRGSSYYIQDEDGNRYHLSEEQYNRVSTQLVSGSTYEIIYFKGVLKNKYVRVLKDASQTYISLNERADHFQEYKICAIRLKTLGKCTIVSFGLALVWYYLILLATCVKQILLYKKHIRYYLRLGVPLPEETKASTDGEKAVPAIEYDSLCAEEAPQVLQQEVLAAQNKYMNKKKENVQLILIGFFLFGGAGVILYTCLMGLLTVGTPTEAEWQTREIIFAEISKESYYKDQNYYCICDQEGNKYALTSSSEYRYYDLTEQLQKGQSYQIVYGVNKYLNKDKYNLYQLSNGSVTYAPLSEALADIQENQKHQKNLSIFCVIWNALLIVMNWLSNRNDIKRSKETVLYCEGRSIFYQHTGIVLPPPPDLFAEEEENKATGTDIKAEATTESDLITEAGSGAALKTAPDSSITAEAKTATELNAHAAAGVTWDSTAEPSNQEQAAAPKEEPALKRYEPVITFMADEDVAAKQSTSAPKFYRQRFAAGNLLCFLAGLIFAIMGGFYIYKGALLWQAPLDAAELYIVSLLLQGILMVPLGLWLMFIFRKRTVEIPEEAIVAYESKSGIIVAWVCYLAGISFTALICWLTPREFYNYTDFIAAMLLVIVPLYFMFLLFGCHRNRRLILTEETIERVTFLGQKSYYERNDVAGMEIVNRRLNILNANGYKMFSLRPSMVQAKEIFLALGGDRYYKYESNDDYADK